MARLIADETTFSKLESFLVTLQMLEREDGRGTCPPRLSSSMTPSLIFSCHPTPSVTLSLSHLHYTSLHCANPFSKSPSIKFRSSPPKFHLWPQNHLAPQAFSSWRVIYILFTTNCCQCNITKCNQITSLLQGKSNITTTNRVPG